MSMISNIIRRSTMPVVVKKQNLLLYGAAVAVSSVVTFIVHSKTTTPRPTSSALSSCEKRSERDQNDDGERRSSFRIESHLMDKIQQKKYITSALAKDGIPQTLRILVIDLPNLHRDGFTGTCRVSHDRVFPDRIAPPKEIFYTTSSSENDGREIDGDIDDDNEQRPVLRQNDRHRSRSKDDPSRKNHDQLGVRNTTRKSTDRPSVGTASNNKRSTPRKLKVPQKILVKRLVECNSPQSQQLVGVELLEASIADLNRYKLRKTQKFGSYKYDPGKYFNNHDDDDDKNNRGVRDRRSTTGRQYDALNDHDEMDGTDVDDDDSNQYDEDERITFALENEMEAPWNQFAWKEELSLRINGQVQFDAAMEPAARLQRVLWGKVYKSTVPTVNSVWDHFLPTFARSDPNGVDGNVRHNVRACHKPHAVIANGAALQMVPGALRQLQRLCKKGDVPLFVVNDPRKWGGNTHQTVDEALKDLRSTVKNRVITQALKQQGSFARGRLLGQAETEAKWQVKERSKRAKEFLGIDGRHRRSERNQDWSSLDAATLQRKLIERKVIQVSPEVISSDSDDDDTNKSVTGRKMYSPGIVELARQITEDLDQDVVEDDIVPARDLLGGPPPSHEGINSF